MNFVDYFSDSFFMRKVILVGDFFYGFFSIGVVRFYLGLRFG